MLIPRNVLSVVDFACTDPGRRQLNGLYLERKDARTCSATATTGKILCSTTWKELDNEEFPGKATVKEGFSTILPIGACKDAQKSIPKKTNKPILEHLAVDEVGMNGTLKVSTNDLDAKRETDVVPIEGPYPNYRHALLDKPPAFSMRLDPVLLRDLCASLARIHPAGARDKPEVRTAIVEFHAPDRPLVFKMRSLDGTVETVAMVMPLVIEGGA